MRVLLVVPLQHTYVPDDHKTCREFDVPLVLSGHDHHRVDEVVAGTRLLKPYVDHRLGVSKAKRAGATGPRRGTSQTSATSGNNQRNSGN